MDQEQEQEQEQQKPNFLTLFFAVMILSFFAYYFISIAVWIAKFFVTEFLREINFHM